MVDGTNPFHPPQAAAANVASKGNCTSNTEVTWEATYDDLLEKIVSESMRGHDKVLPKRRLRSVVLGVLMLLGFAWLWEATRMLPVAVPILVLGIFMFIQAYRLPEIYRRHIQNTAERLLAQRSNDSVLGPQTLTIDQQGLHGRNALAATFWRWAAVVDIEQRDQIVNIYVCATSAMSVPARAFASPQHFQAFCDNARRLRAEANVDKGMGRPATS